MAGISLFGAAALGIFFLLESKKEKAKGVEQEGGLSRLEHPPCSGSLTEDHHKP